MTPVAEALHSNPQHPEITQASGQLAVQGFENGHPPLSSDEESLGRLQERKQEFIENIRSMKPSLSELADIEESVVRPSAQEDFKSGETRPLYIKVRDYTKPEKDIVKRSIRADMAISDADYIFSPFVPEDLQQSIGSSYAKHVQGKLTRSKLGDSVKDGLPYIVATEAIGRWARS
jgi:hypothetical protein